MTIPAGGGRVSPESVRALKIEEWRAEAGPEVPALVPGLLYSSLLTLIAGAPKDGKSTFVYAMLAALERGDTFLGRPTTATRALVLTEEPVQAVREKAQRFGLKDALYVPIAHLRGLDWAGRAAAGARLAREHGAGVLVVDTLARLAELGPDEEQDAGRAEEAMRPLHEAKEGGLAVAVVHHSGKRGGAGVESVRGSSAFPGSADSVLILRRGPKKAGRTCRMIDGAGRLLEQEFSGLMVSLEADCYRTVESPSGEDGGGGARARVLVALRGGPEGMTGDQVRKAAKMNYMAVDEALRDLVEAGEAVKLGGGRRNDPHRYRLQAFNGAPPAPPLRGGEPGGASS